MATSLPHSGFDAVADVAIAATSLSDYRTQLNQFLERVESSSSHYDALGLDQSAPYEHIVRAYHRCVSLLYPAHQFRSTLPEETLDRMDRAFSKASWAFSTLADFKKRADYHSLVLSKNAKPSLTAPIKRDATATLQAVREARRATGSVATLPPNLVSDQQPESELQLNVHRTSQKAVYNEFKAEKKDDNRRRSQRFKLALPARVAGYDRTGAKWSEMTQSVDVSRMGVTLHLRRRVRQGMVVYLTIPLPTKLRSHGFSDASFNTYALVRRVEPPKKGERVVAVEFIGEHPPTGYLEKPWATFKPNQWTGKERRRSGRQNRAEKIRVEYFNDAFESLGREDTVTENISSHGMRLRAARAPFEFDLVRVTCPALRFESLAVVRSRYFSKDGGEQLCLQFVNNSQRSSQPEG